MKVLVLNAGSSSLKCQYFINQENIVTVHMERIGEDQGHSELFYQGKNIIRNGPILTQHDALKKIFSLLGEFNILASIEALDGIGHRVVHGGSSFHQSTHINTDVIEEIRKFIPLAPLHNPSSLEAIESIHRHYPHISQVAVFDTAFHQTMPAHAYLYPLPYSLYEESHIRRFGFHGTSHSYVAKEASLLMGKDIQSLNLITLHLGNGASATAISGGKSIDTSMGMTPLEGLMMGTRCGDIDPAILSYLSEQCGMDMKTIDNLLSQKSGLRGICGHSDMREVIKKAETGDVLSLLALQMYAYRIRKYIGAYTVVLGHVDAVIFTGGVGEHAVRVREMVCEGLEESIRLKIDKEKNKKPSIVARSIEHSESHIKVWIIPTNEELEIAKQVEEAIIKH